MYAPLLKHWASQGLVVIAPSVTQFALGRPLGAEDAPVLAEIDRVAQQAGGTYADRLTAIVE